MDIEGGGDPDWRAGVDGSSPSIARSALLAGMAAALGFALARYTGIFRLIAADSGMWELALAVAVGAGLSRVRRLPVLPRWTPWIIAAITIPSSHGSRYEGLWLLATVAPAVPALLSPRPILADIAALSLLAGPAVAWSLSSTGPGFSPAILAIGAAMSLRAGLKDADSAERATGALLAAVVAAGLSAIWLVILGR